MVYILLRVNTTPRRATTSLGQYTANVIAAEAKRQRQAVCPRQPRRDFDRAPSPKKSRLPRRPTTYYTMGRQSAEAWSTSRNSLCGLELYSLGKSEAKRSHSRLRAQLAHSGSEARFSQKLRRATKPTSRLSTSTCPKRPALSTPHLLALALTLLFAPTTIPALTTNVEYEKITYGCGASKRRAHSRPRSAREACAERNRRADRSKHTSEVNT